MDFIGVEYAKIPRVRRTNFLLTIVGADVRRLISKMKGRFEFN
jgi:hypothetical protein